MFEDGEIDFSLVMEWEVGVGVYGGGLRRW